MCSPRDIIVLARHSASPCTEALPLPAIRGRSPKCWRNTPAEHELIAHDCGLVGNPSHTGIDDIEREYDADAARAPGAVPLRQHRRWCSPGRARIPGCRHRRARGAGSPTAAASGRRLNLLLSCLDRRHPLSFRFFAGSQTASGCTACGEMSEWLKEHAWKVCIRLIPVSRVRIPLSPPNTARLATTLDLAPIRASMPTSMVAPSVPPRR